ncbi:gp213 [Bacillus phage G]|uniref:Gp213 n=1 Tax=Bacillus phage G TaxID=2884420 RepID=G3MBS9_9CAUD|nr:gp213 [Bacillus phage G]AEO93472.1 gp213 [Bacillus phage G]
MKRLIKKSEQLFDVGNVVLFKTHPYDNITPYTIKEVLEDNRYFIENDDNAYTGIDGKNLELLQQ